MWLRALLALPIVVLAAGCSLSSPRAEPPAAAREWTHPAWLSEVYSDGTITVRYPRGWVENRTERFGHVLSDNKSLTAAFVGIQYLPGREYADHAEFGNLATRILRPPDGEGTTLIYTQTARLGGRRGIESSVMWARAPDEPLGPTMRVFGVELPSGEVAVVILAAERQSLHALQFGWIKRMIAWETPTTRE